MTKLLLLFHGRFPSEKAASLFTAQNAEAFAKKGLDVTVIVPRRKGVTGNPFHFYSVEKNFDIVYLPVIDLFDSKFKKLAFWMSMISFSWSVFWYIYKNSYKEDIVYSNEIQPLVLISFLSRKCFYEMHDFPQSKLRVFGYALSTMQWILVHNRWKLQELRKIFSYVNPEKCLYEPNAVNIQEFNLNMPTEEARKKLGLPLDKKIAVYTGHLYGWKGVDTLAQAAEKLDNKYLIIFVGGTEKDVKSFKDRYGKCENIKIVGHKSHQEIPLWQKAADVLILPNTAKEAISAYYTSPMKLFEYMASKKPIIASDIPSIREILDEKTATLVVPDDVKALSSAIVNVTSSINTLSQEAFNRVQNHTWEKRAERIIDFINKRKGIVMGLNKSRIWLLIRYLFSGLLSFFTNILLLFMFTNYFHLWYLYSSTLAFIIAVVVSFLAQKFITFQDRTTDRTHRQLVMYILIALFNVVMNAIFMYIFVEIFSLHYLISQIISAGIIAFWNLVVYRFIIFSHAKIS